MAEDDDPVAHEVDVYLSKSLAENLYLFQYPVRPSCMTYDDAEPLAAKIKPKQQKVEIELALNTDSANYAKSKGQQIALNVDVAAGAAGDGSFFSSDMMDKQVLSSTLAIPSTSRYVAAVFKEGELHLTPLHGIVQLRPSFNYIDKSDNIANNPDTKAQVDAGESSQDEEEDAKPVTVRFARRETEEAKARRMASYSYVSKRLEEEPWIHVTPHQISSPTAETERLQLFARQTNEVSEFQNTAKDYLHKLIPPDTGDEGEKPAMPMNVLSMTQLKNMTLGDQIKALMKNAKVISLSQLLTLLPKDTDITAALRLLQQVAMLVQGCWVVKSEVLYPKDTFSAHSGVAAEVLCRGRDYVMWKFTQNRFVIRKDISSIIKLPAEDVKDTLEQMARYKINKGWEFLLEYDAEFMNRYPEVVQRQQMLWEAKFQQLAKMLKIKEADKGKGEGDKTRRRRLSSRSRHKSGDKSMSDQSDTDSETQKGRRSRTSSLSCDQPQTTTNHIVNGLPQPMDTDSGPVASAELKRELVNFVQDKLLSRYVLTLTDLRRLFNLKLAQCPPGHVLGSGVSDKLLEQAVIEVGGQRLQNQWPPGVRQEPIYALAKIGDRLDKARSILVNMFSSTLRTSINSVKAKMEEELAETVSEADVRKLMRDYCVTKGGRWVLKGVFTGDS